MPASSPAVPPHLTTPRATGSARVNVGSAERTASAIGGSLLMLLGLKRRSLVGLIAAGIGGALLYRGTTGHCPVFEQLGMDSSDQPLTEPIEIAETLTVNRPREEVYQAWRRFEDYPTFMEHLKEVRPLGDRRSHWVAKGPGPTPDVAWDARVVEDEENEVLAWRSLPDADVDNSGHVRFKDAPGGGTELHVRIAYRPPAGQVGRHVADWLGPVLSQMVKEDVRRFKHMQEAGEVPQAEARPSGDGSS